MNRTMRGGWGSRNVKATNLKPKRYCSKEDRPKIDKDRLNQFKSNQNLLGNFIDIKPKYRTNKNDNS